MSVDEVIAFYRSMGFFEGLSDAELLEGFEERQGRTPDPLDPDHDLALLSFDKRRVWCGDPEADVHESNQVYRELLPAWAGISGGALEVKRVHEHWESDDGPVTVRFTSHGIRHEIQPVVEDDWIDLTVLADLNRIIEPSGVRYALRREDNGALVLVAPSADIERMSTERELAFDPLPPRAAAVRRERSRKRTRKHFMHLVDAELGETLRGMGFAGRPPVYRRITDGILQVVELESMSERIRIECGVQPFCAPSNTVISHPERADVFSCALRWDLKPEGPGYADFQWSVAGGPCGPDNGLPDGDPSIDTLRDEYRQKHGIPRLELEPEEAAEHMRVLFEELARPALEAVGTRTGLLRALAPGVLRGGTGPLRYLAPQDLPTAALLRAPLLQDLGGVRALWPGFFEQVDAELGEELRARGFRGGAPAWRKVCPEIVQIVEVVADLEVVRKLTVGVHPRSLPVGEVIVDPSDLSAQHCAIGGQIGGESGGPGPWRMSEKDEDMRAAARALREGFVQRWAEPLAAAETLDGLARELRPASLFRRAGRFAAPVLGPRFPLVRAHVELVLGHSRAARKLIDRTLDGLPGRASSLRRELEHLRRQCE